MMLKYNIDVSTYIIADRLHILVNQVYKLLPIREQHPDAWQKPLQTITEQIAGIWGLLERGYPELFFPLLNKLEGLHSLTKDDDFPLYRRVIFQCLNIMNEIQAKVCHQKQ